MINSAHVLWLLIETMRQRPDVDLSNVTHIYQWYIKCYGEEIADKTNLYTAIKTNQAYEGKCKNVATLQSHIVATFTYN